MSVAKTRVLRWISGNTQKNRIHNKEICLKIGWLLLTKRWERFARDGLVMFKGELESTDAAGRVPHPSLTWRDAGRGVRRSWSRVSAASEFFFFFLDSRWLGSIWANAAWFAPNQADSAILSRIGRRPIRPKQAEIGLESGRKILNSHLRGIVMCFLPSSFFVLWIKYINVFFKNILIVKIYK